METTSCITQASRGPKTSVKNPFPQWSNKLYQVGRINRIFRTNLNVEYSGCQRMCSGPKSQLARAKINFRAFDHTVCDPQRTYFSLAKLPNCYSQHQPTARLRTKQKSFKNNMNKRSHAIHSTNIVIKENERFSMIETANIFLLNPVAGNR